ncbi:MAG: rhodanese-like domain-containing protein [Parafilimonas sp.]
MFSSSLLNAQTTVKSKIFNLVLKSIISNKVPEISVEDAFLNRHNCLFLDAREPEEYNVSHLQNAIFAGYKNFSMSSVQNISKNKPVIVYCAVGKRSATITERLVNAGFTNVHNLYGGIFEWVNEDLPVYNAQNKQTDSVHAFSHFWGHFLDKGKKVY